MIGRKSKQRNKPVPLQLYGKDLPWVSTATHLGHEIHEDGTMNFDCKQKRAKFIDGSVSIREAFKFAKPEQVLKAIQVHCFDFYGGMLWDLYGDQAGQLYRSWNTCCKLVWNLPRQTHSYFVDNLLSCGYQSLRSQVISRYANFVRTLLASPSKEVAVVARIAGMDVSSNTGKNILNIKLETRLCPAVSPLYQIKEFFGKPTPFPESQQWRLPMLLKYVNIRDDQQVNLERTDYIDSLITSLCTT